MTPLVLLQHALALVALWVLGGCLLRALDVALAEGLVLLTAGYLARTLPLMVRAITGGWAVLAVVWWLKASPEERATLAGALTRPAAVEAQHEPMPDIDVLAGGAP